MDYFQLFFITLLILIAGVYLWLKQQQVYWSKRNIPNEPKSLYFFGIKQHIAFYLQDIYTRFQRSNRPFVGMFLAFSPAVLLLDLDLIKAVFISDFEYFPDRGFYHNVRDDPLSGNIVRLEGEAWKRLRTKLTPTFTSGKMKFMFPTVVEVGERFVTVMHELLQLKGAEADQLEIRDLCARFTTDVIGSVAFGIECNSLRAPNTEFRMMGDRAFGCFNPIIESLGTKFPQLFHKLHVKAFPRELIDFYSRIVTENIEYRERNQIRRNDFLDILIELKNTKVNEGDVGDFSLTLEEIIGQAFVFFIGGFETSSSTMSFCLYELSRNPAVQERARADVVNSLKAHDNQLSYECLRDMQYLEQVLSETLRKYPVAPTLKRVTRKDYPVPGTPFTFERNLAVLIPVYAIQHDPLYYPAPHKFDPDRFSPLELQRRPAMSYLPFGAGPRICIAERFGKMQTLIGLAMLLRNFKFTAVEKTPKTLDYDNKNFRIFSVKGGIHLQVERV